GTVACESLPRRPRLLLALVAALTTLPLLTARELWRTDEPRYAQVGREILSTGDWIVMHWNAQVYTEKPPLYFWCEAVLARLSGGDVGSAQARLPSMLCGIAGVVLCFELGRRFFAPRTAFLGALLLATTGHYFWVSQRCALDAMLTTFVLAAVLLAEHAWRSDLRDDRGRAAALWCASFGVLGFGVLAKGPVALLSYALALGTRAWAARSGRPLARLPWLRA